MTPEEDEKRLMSISSLARRYGISEKRAAQIVDGSGGITGGIAAGAMGALTSLPGAETALAGVQRLLPGGGSMAQERADTAAWKDQLKTENPAIFNIANIGGALTGPAGFVKKAATKYLPKAAAKFPQITGGIANAIESGLYGTASGAADTIGNDQSMVQRGLSDGGVGTAFGAGLPIAGKIAKGLGLVGGTLVSGRDPRVVNKLYESMKRNPNLKFGEEMPYLADQEKLAKYAGDLKNDVMDEGGKRHALLLKAEEEGKGLDLADFEKQFSPFDQSAKRYVKDKEGDAILASKDSYIKAARQKFGGEGYGGGEKLGEPDVTYYHGPYEGKSADRYELPGNYSPIINEFPVSPLHTQDTIKSLSREGRLADKSLGPKDLTESAATKTRGGLNEAHVTSVPGLEQMNKQMQTGLNLLDKLRIKPEITTTGDFRFSPDSMNALAKRLALSKSGSDELKMVQGLLDEVGAPKDLIQNLRDTYIQHSFQSGNPSGSKGVNLYRAVGELAGNALGSEKAGSAGGAITGAVFDRMGPPAVRVAAKVAAKVASKIPQKYRDQFSAAAAKSPSTVNVLHEMLMKNDSEYNKAMTQTDNSGLEQIPQDSGSGLEVIPD